MIFVEPVDSPRDAPLRLTNARPEPEALGVIWTDGMGGRFDGQVVVPPGEHVADELGFFWDLACVRPPKRDPTIAERLAPVRLTLSNGVDLIRRTVPPGVSSEMVTADGLRGVLFVPEGALATPSVIVLAGSSGGYWLEPAALLAGHGLVTLALAYFGVPGLPDDLIDIPLEYVQRAIAWMATRPEVDPGPISVMGASKGGELALLLAATVPGVGRTVAYVPSGQTHGWGDPEALSACWTWRGEPLPFAVMDRGGNHFVDGRLSIRAGYESTIADPAEAERTAIRVENAAGPLLLISGGDDLMWPSTPFSERAVARARAGGVTATHLSYPRAGHAIGTPNRPGHPLPGDFFALGGTPQANAAASRDAWKQVVAFLTG